MNNFECPICYQKYDNPLECLQCHNNFCKKHLLDLNNKCPMCNACPLRYTENTWLRRTVMNMNLYECTLCGFEGDERSFWSHLIESHKAEVIAQFKKKFGRDNNNQNIQNNDPEKVKESMYTNPGPVSNSVNPLNEEEKYQQVLGNNPPNPFNNNFVPNIQNYGDNHVQNPVNFGPGVPMNNWNNPDKNGPPTHRPTKIIKDTVKKIPPKTERTIKYCGRINQFIKCNCCPDHICRKGNCMCVDCMRENINKFKLDKNTSLINKVGKIARLNKGSYYCNCEYETIIQNVIGKRFKRKSKCCFPFPPCDNCKNLEKLKDIYLSYL